MTTQERADALELTGLPRLVYLMTALEARVNAHLTN